MKSNSRAVINKKLGTHKQGSGWLKDNDEIALSKSQPEPATLFKKKTAQNAMLSMAPMDYRH